MIHFLRMLYDEDISVNVDLSDTPGKDSTLAMRTSAPSQTEKYIDKIYDKAAKSELRKEILLELRHRFPAIKN